ncbi:hypothetical protein Droror1_Dr00020193 [Drosera rotundifolia]
MYAVGYTFPTSRSFFANSLHLSWRGARQSFQQQIRGVAAVGKTVVIDEVHQLVLVVEVVGSILVAVAAEFAAAADVMAEQIPIAGEASTMEDREAPVRLSEIQFFSVEF